MLNQIKKKAKNIIRHLILSNKRYRLEDSIVICGEARSGSTWLMEILNQIPNSVINWEPLQHELGVVPKHFNFGWRPYIVESDDNPEFLKFFNGVLRYRIYNKWTTKFLKLKGLSASKYVITKFVRANSLLPWLTTNFGASLKNKPVFLTRHPITNCISQLKTFRDLQGAEITKEFAEFIRFEIPEGINSSRFEPHVDFINSLNSVLERTIAVWCVNTVPVLNHSNKERWIEVCYEDLMLSPEEEVSKIIDQFQLKIKEETFKNFDFGRASASNYKGDFKRDPKAQLEAFVEKLGEDYLHKIQRIFDYFELTTYSAFNAYPIKKH